MFGLAFGLAGLGIVLVTVGSFVTIIKNPKQHNDQVRAYLDPVRKGISKDAWTALDRKMWKDRHGRWFLGIGLVLFFLGAGLLMTRGHLAGPTTKIDTEQHK